VRGEEAPLEGGIMRAYLALGQQAQDVQQRRAVNALAG
jgi:hypothetical protein